MHNLVLQYSLVVASLVYIFTDITRIIISLFVFGTVYFCEDYVKNIIKEKMVILCTDLVPIYVEIMKLIKGSSPVSITTTKNRMTISYWATGGNVQLNLPYSRTLNMRKYTGVVDGKNVDIAHPRGVPFLCTPMQMGYEKIYAHDGMKLVGTFSDDEKVTTT